MKTVDKEEKKGEKEMKKKENRKKGCTYIKLYGYESIYFRKKNRNKKQNQKQLKVKEIENCGRRV